MAQPTKWEQQVRFSQTLGNQEGLDLDLEFDNGRLTVSELRANLGLIQRDDGALQNDSVTPDTLDTATLLMMDSDLTPRGEWTTGILYNVSDLVEVGATGSFIAVTQHIAGASFAVDKAAGKWVTASGVTAAELGSTANGFGASLIGVEDVGGYFTGDDVEAALQEVGGLLQGVNEDVGSIPRTFTTIALLKAATAKGDMEPVNVLGYYSAGDGGGGSLYWDSAATDTDNGGTIIQSNVGGTGRWKRVNPKDVSYRQFGCKGDNSANDTVNCQSALTAIISTKGVLRVTPGTYLSGNLTLTNAVDVTILGEGGKMQWTGTGSGGDYIGFQIIGICTNLEIKGVRMNGDAISANRHAGIWNQSGQTLTNCRWINNYVTNVVYGLGQAADSSGTVTGGLIEGNYLDTIVGVNSGEGYGIHVTESASTGQSFTRILGNTVVSAQRHSIYCARGEGYVIQGNTIKDHRVAVPAGGFRPAIVISRCIGVQVIGNVVDRYADGALEISRAATSLGDATNDCRRITVVGNTFLNPQNAVPPVFIGSQAPATEGTPQDIIFANNTVYTGAAASALVIYCALRMKVSGNSFVLQGASTSVVTIRCEGDGSATASYTDDILISDNHIVGIGVTNTGIKFDTEACTAASRITILNNRINVTGATFSCAATITNPNVFAFGQAVDGLLTNISPNVAGHLSVGLPLAIEMHLELTEVIAETNAPTANKVRMYARDNGAGKTQIVARFPTGAVQQIAIEP